MRLNYLRNEPQMRSFAVAVQEISPQLIMSLSQDTTIVQLEKYVEQSIQLLTKSVTEQGGEVTGPPLGIFHGFLDADGGGPVEVCLPVGGKFAVTGDMVLRKSKSSGPFGRQMRQRPCWREKENNKHEETLHSTLNWPDYAVVRLYGRRED